MRAQIEDFERHRCILGRFLAQGSAYWYAPTGGPVKTEEAPLYLDTPAPKGPAVETIEEEEYAVLSADGLESVVLRYGIFYGPGIWYSKDGDGEGSLLLYPRGRCSFRDRGDLRGSEAGSLQRRRRPRHRRGVDASLRRGARDEAAAAGSCVRCAPHCRKGSGRVVTEAPGRLQREA
jgi:hypothetical protein